MAPARGGTRGRRGGCGRNPRDFHQDGFDKSREDAIKVDNNSPVIQEFLTYRQDLDCRHDKHERIVKLSRDITIESKRVIFLLHRSISEDKGTILLEAEEKLKQMEQTLFKSLAIELHEQDPYMYIKAYYAGLQEYIEAITFYDYIKEQSLSTNWETLQQKLTYKMDGCTSKDDLLDKATRDDGTMESEDNVVADQSADTRSVHIPPCEYMLGLLDLSGELMRMCISAIGSGDRQLPHELCDFVRQMHRAFERVDSSASSFAWKPRQKLAVLRQSLQKMERTCYTILVRGEEVPPDRLADVASGGGSGGGHRLGVDMDDF